MEAATVIVAEFLSPSVGNGARTVGIIHTIPKTLTRELYARVTVSEAAQVAPGVSLRTMPPTTTPPWP